MIDENYHFQVWVGTKCLGEGERGPVIKPYQAPESIAYFCSACGEVWARLVIEGQEFRVWAMPCKLHQPRWRTCVAGSLLMDWDKDYNAALPYRAWLREVLVHAHWYERMGHGFSLD